MIRQQFFVESYWKVVIWWNLDYSLFNRITEDMRIMRIHKGVIEVVLDKMKCRKAKAVTISNIDDHTSIVLFNTHKSKKDYLNSIVHEAEHIKQAMLRAYNVKDKGEPPAYTIGYLIERMWEVFEDIICITCKRT